MAKKRKLVERTWAIRVDDTTADNSPKYLHFLTGLVTFETKREAVDHVRANGRQWGQGHWIYWTPVRVDVTER